MRRFRLTFSLVAALAAAIGVFNACSSDDSTSTPATGGAGGAAGQDASAGTGGAAGTGGTAGAGGAVDASARDSSPADTSAPDAPGTMTLTSSAFANGGAFPPANTCAGVNTSPPLTWTAGPTGVMSYAVDLTDMTNGAVHWVIWDLPANTTSLPAALPGDATLTTPVMGKQLHRAAFFGAGFDYRGPCPNGNVHNYRFQVNA